MSDARISFTECRTFGHVWHITDVKRDQGVEDVVLHCPRCSMTRHDVVFAGSGRLFKRRYEAPENYYYGKDEEVPTRDDFRGRLIEAFKSAHTKPAKSTKATKKQ